MTNLERWHTYLQDIESPNIYIDWTYYAMISAAVQRRIAWGVEPHCAPKGSIFPNPYIIFIGPPGVGKSSAARWAVELFKCFGGWEDAASAHKRKVKVAPSSITVEQLYRYLAINCLTPFTIPGSDPKEKGKGYLSSPCAFFCTEELGSLLRENNNDLVNFLQEGWDCGDFHRETKTQGIDVIQNMCLMLLGAATPSWVQEVSRNGLLKQGFAARTIFVWGEQKRHTRLEYFFNRPEQTKAWDELKQHVGKLLNLYGAMQPTPEARKFLTEWYENGGEDKKINSDKKLEDYYSRKKVHLMKMSMVAHLCETPTLTLDVPDIKRALEMLARTEIDMHKALLGSGSNNPAFAAADRIKKTLEDAGDWVREGVLLNEVFEFMEGGRITFDEAIRFLQDSGQIQSQPMGGRIHFRLTVKD